MSTVSTVSAADASDNSVVDVIESELQADLLPEPRRSPLPPPRDLLNEFPSSEQSRRVTQETRKAIRRILRREDRRMVVVVGPCSIHDTEAALEYAARLKELQAKLSERLLLVMRTYLEKPRTTVGWRGLVNDPHLDGSYDMAEGLRRSRHLLAQITDTGLPVATEVLDIAVPSYIGDLVSFAAVGARTTESQPHRALASGLAMPVGFKNGTDGSIQTALDAMVSARESHSYLGITDDGGCCVLQTPGNADTMLILRGGKASGPNYGWVSIFSAEAKLERLGVRPSLMVDCSHANSDYNPARQATVLESVAKSRQQGSQSLMGVMIESHLFPGKQKLTPGGEGLQYGVSVTDGCIGWDETVSLLERLHTALAD
ncbi:MAG: 3-deoxy-7-phosphoheptulonate synthase [Armatimonadaceae bacterium]